MSPASRFRMPLPEPGPPAPSEARGVGNPGPRLPCLDAERVEPFPRLVDVRDLSCSACRAPCRYESSTGRHPGSPEFLRAHPDVWLGFVIDPKTDTLAVVAACSESCVQRLLRE